MGEIEATLAQHPAVQSAVVAALGDDRANKRLIAYVVANPELTTTSNSTGGQAYQDYGMHQAGVTIFDPLDRLEFKLAHHNLYQDDTAPSVPLAHPALDGAFGDRFLTRRSYRKFQARPVPFERFSHLLAGLMQVELPDIPLPKYQYGSAGSLYPVQTYLCIKPGAVEDLTAGTYYYHPRDHRLLLLCPGAQIGAELYQGPNRAAFDAAGFALFFVAQMDAIRPIYGEWSENFCLLEAGSMVQTLEAASPGYQIGLCQIGGLPGDAVREYLGLGPQHLYLHSLLGGAIEPEQTTYQALVEDSAETRFFMQILQERRARGPDFQYTLPPAVLAPAGSQALAEELRSFLKDRLPEYMVPEAFVAMGELPLTANGKVDRKALPNPDLVSSTPETAYAPPRSEAERVAAAVLAEVLKKEKIGVHDNFFQLGANSLHLVQAHRKLEEAFGRKIPITTMFEHPTVRDLAGYLSQEEDPGTAVQESQERSQMRKDLMKQRMSQRRRNQAAE